jgi:ribonuclease HI
MAKWYVVFEGLKPGIYTSWHECDVLKVHNARYQSYKTHDEVVHEFNEVLRMGTMRQVKGITKTTKNVMPPIHAYEGKNVMIKGACSGKNVIIVILVVLLFVLGSRLPNCCSCK